VALAVGLDFGNQREIKPDEEIKMAHGGSRPGAGRKRGSKNKNPPKSRVLATEMREKAQASGVTPLEFFCNIYRDEAQPQEIRIAAAEAAMPYVHPKLSMIAARVDQSVVQTTPEERAGLEAERKRKELEELDFAFRERPAQE
jgi:hypothetical protein